MVCSNYFKLDIFISQKGANDHIFKKKKQIQITWWPTGK